MLEITVNNTKFDKDVRTKIASRALIVKENKVAVLYSKKYDFYVTPGGGVEESETLEEACIREAKEETGFLVKPLKQIAVLNTNYPRMRIIHNYFICEYVKDENELGHTVQEVDQDLELKWMSLIEVKQAFSKQTSNIKYDAWMQRESIVIAELRDYLM